VKRGTFTRQFHVRAEKESNRDPSADRHRDDRKGSKGNRPDGLYKKKALSTTPA